MDYFVSIQFIMGVLSITNWVEMGFLYHLNLTGHLGSYFVSKFILIKFHLVDHLIIDLKEPFMTRLNPFQEGLGKSPTCPNSTQRRTPPWTGSPGRNSETKKYLRRNSDFKSRSTISGTFKWTETGFLLLNDLFNNAESFTD